MKLALDAMGGDYAPQEIVLGGLDALNQYDFMEKLYLVGKRDAIEAVLKEAEKNQKIDYTKLEIVEASEVIEMDDHPATAYRRKKDASITVATRLVKEGTADAVVSAGSTGGQMVSALFGLGRIKGVNRPAIGCIIPTYEGGKLLVDAGANTNVDENNLVQFAQMGSIYMNCVMGMENPRVGLINNGSEETKGSELTQAVYQRLKEMPDLNFVGNLEGRDVPFGRADVMTCDGFTGNVVLKTMEGMAKVIMEMLQEEVYASTRGKVGGMLLKPSLRNLKKKMDYAEYGGAPLLGVNGVSVVCHGSSKARAIFKAIEVANTCCESRFVEKIKGKYETKSEQ
ncbi:MAG: phosphate acyltransferase PlsX [Peptococcaceae bacterium]|nr:phosphate acyltransferase PlsX [Peptococcaceae bacterium]MBO5139439.1 phosphate acyltransferase PlsX [Peptococcaceae bacterium]MBO5302128.1 phosphate acyltransferase PlsX [Peptococcaceae bacterium]MBO5366765.1 phosphate acyltransferase PlsX [Peptococcaceae bacterium]MBO5428578.1 phosphate acyltransferase PlsX [Peptococcaceae bacterium]